MNRLSLCLALLALPGCNRLSEDDDEPTLGSTPGLLVSQSVGPAGGTVQVSSASSPYFGVQVVIPPGALASTVNITITDATGKGSLPAGMYDFEFGPAGQTFALPVSVTVKYSTAYVTDFLISDPTKLRVVGRDANDDPDILVTTSQDAVLRTITAATTHFSRFAAVLFSFVAGSSGEHYRLVAQRRMLATQVHEAAVAGVSFVVASTMPGAAPVTVGKGSVANLFATNDNLILVHSTADDARNFVGANDLVAGLDAQYPNIAVYQYKSGRSIAENGNWLYNEIKRNAGAGFKTDLLGYSLGGIVARYALERSKDDAARTQLPNYDAATCSGPLDGLVGNFITMGSPHGGAVDEVILSWVEPTGVLAIPTVANWFPGLTDNSQTGGTATALNAAFVNNASRYFLIAGASGASAFSAIIAGPDDGLVSVASATAVPSLVLPEEALAFPPAGDGVSVYNHANLHAEAVTNGIRDQIVTWINTP